MTFSPSFASIARSVAVTSLMGAALVAGSIGPTFAQSPTQKPPAAAAATSSKPETLDQRISTLKAALKITPDQEPKWEKVATAMRDNSAAMEKLVADKKGKMANMNAIDDLKTYQAFSQQNLDGLKNLISAFSSLYDSMTPEQKANADKVFDSYGPAKTPKQG